MNREIIYSASSPNSEWNLVVSRPSEELPHFSAQIHKRTGNEFYNFPFGHAFSDNFELQWELCKDVCGFFIDENCYALFYYGINTRNKPRYRARTSPQKPLTPETIADFGKGNLLQYKKWEGIYPIPDMHEGKCAWCRKEQNSFWVVVFEGVSETTETQSDVVCDLCVKAALEFIKMRKQGLPRKLTLKDFGYR